jgi:hypothetical protein
MRYLCIIIAVGIVALGALLGSIIRIGHGSGAVIGGFVGIVLGCLYVDAARKHSWHPLLRPSANDLPSSEINQKALKDGMLPAQQAHIVDDMEYQRQREHL